MSATNGRPSRTSPRTPRTKPIRVQADARTYVVTSEDDVRTYHRARFLVTDAGELAVLRLDAKGRDDFVVALYADRHWCSIVVEGADESPATDDAEKEARARAHREREERRNPRLPLD